MLLLALSILSDFPSKMQMKRNEESCIHPARRSKLKISYTTTLSHKGRRRRLGTVANSHEERFFVSPMNGSRKAGNKLKYVLKARHIVCGGEIDRAGEPPGEARSYIDWKWNPQGWVQMAPRIRRFATPFLTGEIDRGKEGEAKWMMMMMMMLSRVFGMRVGVIKTRGSCENKVISA